MSPFLSQAEIDEACHPLKQPAAQVRHLAALGIPVKRKPGGQALVLRQHLDAALAGQPHPTHQPQQPNAAAVIDFFTRRRVIKGIA